MYGELIRAARKKKGWTQSDLAYKLGINPVGIVQWEQNRRNPKFETRQKIARALDIDITEPCVKYSASVSTLTSHLRLEIVV